MGCTCNQRHIRPPVRGFGSEQGGGAGRPVSPRREEPAEGDGALVSRFCRFLLNMEVEKLQREQWSLAVGVPGSQARSVGIYSWGWRRSLTRGGG